MAKRKNDTLVGLIIFFGFVSLISGAKVLTQGEAQPRKAA
jgi:hypothetical protein